MKDIISDVILALGHSVRVSGLDLTDDDDDGSRVDDFNCDDKGVHHNKEDNPFPLKIRRLYTQSQNSLWTANGTDIRDLHRDHLAHHDPSVPIQLANHHGSHPTTVSKIPPG